MAALSWIQGPPGPTAEASTADPLYLLLVLGGLALGCYGSLAGAALLIYSPGKLQLRHKNGKGLALVAELEQRDPEYQVVARCLALGGLIAAFLLVPAAVTGPAQTVTLLSLGAVALLFCGVLPAAVAEKRAEATLVASLPALRLGRAILRFPVVLPIRLITRAFLSALRIRDEAVTSPDDVAEEVMAAVSDSVTDDALQEEERSWIGNILELKDLQVSEAMTPRTDIVAVPAAMSLREAIQFTLKHGFSRYPVFDGRIDEVVGVFYVKDALRLVPTNGESRTADLDAPVRSMMREPLFVPETMAVVPLLRRFKAERLQMAIVLDEYGGTAGVISIEDILEEIVGDIDDEYDADEDEARIDEVDKGRVIEVPARTRVADVNAMLGTELPEHDDYDTIAGYVISHLNRIPVAGETITLAGVEIQVLKADDRRLRRLRVTAVQPEPLPESG